MSEYNPASSADETAIASPAPAPEPLGDGGIKALNSERERAKALERQNKQLEAMLAENKRALEQTNLTLEEKYRQEAEAYKASLLSQAEQAIAERDALLQRQEEARLAAEQRAQILENQRAVAAISNEFSQTFADVLINPRKVNAYMKEIEDDLIIDANGQPALIAQRDANGEPTQLAPISAAIAYFQQVYPEDFKPPAQQKTGGGYRNLATGGVPQTRSSEPELEIDLKNLDPAVFLANRDRIAKGEFTVVKK